MDVHIFSLGLFQTNCYLIVDPATKDAVIVDAGQDPDELLEAAKGLNVKEIWLTHAHLDHIAGLEQIKAATGAKVLIHEIEKDWLTDPNLNGSARYAGHMDPITGPGADGHFAHGDTLTVGSYQFEVRFTPGHTPGHVVFVTDGMVFAGDTLFQNGIGRTDLYGGDAPALIKSIREQLYTLPVDTVVYPGHGPETTVGYERQNNWAVNDKGDILSDGPNVRWT